MPGQSAENEATTPYVIGIDVGGTKILAAVVNGSGEIAAQAKQKTRAKEGPEAVLERIAATARQAVDKANIGWDRVAGVGIGAPGPVDPDSGIVFQPPNLAGWDQVALGPQLSQSLGVPVCLENDVNLGTLGEFSLGAGRGTKDMVGVFVGTGVGGGLILDGKLRSGFRHAAGEVGHMIVLADGPLCGCGKRGCLESVASRTAIVRDIRGGLAVGRESLIPKLTKDGKRRLTSGVLAKAYRRGDPLVREVFSRAQWYLGLLTASIVNLIDPEMVVFGGGVVEALEDEFLAPVRVTARQYYIQQRHADRVRIVPATLGDYAGVLGAAVMAYQHSCTTSDAD
ncbi:MAG: ROK family protein [Anaerolineae bacterium]